MEFLSLGVVNDSFGLEGTLKIYSTTNMSSKRYKVGNKVFLFNPQTNERTEHEVLSFRHNGFFDFVKLTGIDNPEDAKALKGYEIHVEKNREDSDGSYYKKDDCFQSATAEATEMVISAGEEGNSEGELFYMRRDRMEELILAQFPEANAELLEPFIESYYETLYPDEA